MPVLLVSTILMCRRIIILLLAASSLAGCSRKDDVLAIGRLNREFRRSIPLEKSFGTFRAPCPQSVSTAPFGSRRCIER